MEQNNELAHYGVLGMKWGVRKEKYYANKAKKSSGEKAKKYTEKLIKQKKANKKYKKAYRAQILSDPTKLYKHRKDFSKEEIDKAMNNFNREERLRNYSQNKQNSKLNTIKRITAYGTAALGTYAVVKKGKKIVDDMIFNHKYKQMSLF